MSWIIQTLLRNSIQTKEEHKMDSDSYNDLLILEKRIENLHKERVVTDFELDLIDYFSGKKPDNEKIRSMDRSVVQRKFTTLCNKLAYYLGGMFTDEGYLNYLQNKYNLSEEQIEELKTYMKGKHRHTLSRKK